MKIPVSLISKNSYALIGNEVEALLMICFMHYHGRITDAKMFGMFKGLRLNFKGSPMGFGFDYFSNLKPNGAKPLLRMVNTYHNSINDSWYNHEAMYTILQETFFEVAMKPEHKEMSLDTFMKYLNLFLGKGKRYCYGFIEREIIDKVHNIFEYNFDMGVDLFKEMGLVATGSYVSYYNFDATGYCCDDCDGDYEVYKKGQYKRYVIDRMMEDINKQLTNNKKRYYEIYK